LGGDNHSQDEVNKALEGLTAEDLYRLKRAAGRLASDLPIEALDLVNETALRFQDGRRNWTRGYPFIVVFRGAMRSVADEIRDDEAIGPFGAKSEEEEETLEDRLVDQATPQRQLEGERLKLAFVDEFGRDEHVQKVIDGRIKGHTARDVQNMTGMSATDYDAARKRLDRWYEKVTNEGAES
jgi:hypothetical protein